MGVMICLCQGGQHSLSASSSYHDIIVISHFLVTAITHQEFHEFLGCLFLSLSAKFLKIHLEEEWEYLWQVL